MEHGDEMRTLQVAVGELSAFLRQGPRSLGQLHDDTVRVVDALGMSIPVPILFCSTWEVGFVLSQSRSSNTRCCAGI